MRTLLLIADVVALVVLAYGIYRIVSAARIRAAENRFSSAVDHSPISEGERALSLEMSSRFATGASLDATPDWHEEKPPELIAFPVALTVASSDQGPPAIEEDLPYADPVDGMPFGAEETVVPCVCGLAYREDSVAWLAEYHAGCCIHCGAKVYLPKTSP